MIDHLKKAFVLLLTLFVLASTSQADDDKERKEGVFLRFAANTRGIVVDGVDITVTAQALPPDMNTPFANGGVEIYNKTVLIPEDVNVLFVTISATGNSHNGARLLLACLVDGKSCMRSQMPGSVSPPAGWVTIQRHKNYNLNYASGAAAFIGDGLGGAGDLHDNSVYYTWCTRIKKGEEHGAIHNVKIKMASQHIETLENDLQGLVSIRAVYFYIDGARLPKKDACTEDTTMIPTTK